MSAPKSCLYFLLHMRLKIIVAFKHFNSFPLKQNLLEMAANFWSDFYPCLLLQKLLTHFHYFKLFLYLFCQFLSTWILAIDRHWVGIAGVRSCITLVNDTSCEWAENTRLMDQWNAEFCVVLRFITASLI